mgnify:CR=1 FL=1
MGNNQCGCGPKHVDQTDNRKSGKFSSGKKPKKKQSRFNSVTTDIVEQEDMFFETEPEGGKQNTNETL